jgi:hypothetical protein
MYEESFRFELPGNGRQEAREDQQSQRDCGENGPPVEREAKAGCLDPLICVGVLGNRLSHESILSLNYFAYNPGVRHDRKHKDTLDRTG